VKHIFVLSLVLAALAAHSSIARAQTAANKPDSAAKAPDTAATVHVKSPYQDFRQRQVIEFQLGYFGGNTGDAGVGPQGAPVIGLAYGHHLGGPVFIFGQAQYATSKRTVLDPTPGLTPEQRDLGTISAPLIMVDVGLMLAITGEKAWHGLVPTAGFAFGMAIGDNTPDVGGYKFGSKFYLGIGAGIRKPIKGPWVLSIDVWDYLWQLQYPTTYFAAGANSILPVNGPDKQWTNNGVFTIGLTYVLRK
jgi:hypothetical protein